MITIMPTFLKEVLAEIETKTKIKIYIMKFICFCIFSY